MCLYTVIKPLHTSVSLYKLLSNQTEKYISLKEMQVFLLAQFLSQDVKYFQLKNGYYNDI